MNPTLHNVQLGDGPVLVLVHGFPFDHSMWQPQMEALAATHRVIVPDLPGFGDSPLVDGWTIDSAAAAINQLLDSLHVSEPVALGGLSMGGYIAMSFARQFPRRLASLILADTKSPADDAAARDARNAMIAKARGEGSAAIAQAMLPKLLGATAKAGHPELADRVRAMMVKQSAASIAAALEALRDRPDATPGLAAIAVPTLVIVGEEDEITPPKMSEALAAAIPGAKLEVIPKAGHLANLEQKQAFNAALIRFLGGG